MLVNLKTTTEAYLYILTSLLISIALIPILLTKKPAPEFTTPKFLSLNVRHPEDLSLDIEYIERLLILNKYKFNHCF